MLTFEDQYTMGQQISKDYSSSTLTMLKRDINDGAAMFLNRLGRKFNLETATADIVANQQFYQLSEEMLRSSSVRVKGGNFWYVPELITSEDEWNRINAITPTATFPIFWYIQGFDQIGLYPEPSQDVTGGLKITYNPQHIQLTAPDYTTGTVTINNGEDTVVGTDTTFTESMVGQWLQVTDGSDGRFYKVANFTDATHITLDNYYEGDDVASVAYRIGQVMKIPQAYQDAPVYYALEKYYLTQNDSANADAFKLRFEDKVKSAKATYGRSTANMGVQKNGLLKRKPKWIDLTPPVTYP